MEYFAIFMGTLATISGYQSKDPLEAITMCCLGFIAIAAGVVDLIG